MGITNIDFVYHDEEEDRPQKRAGGYYNLFSIDEKTKTSVELSLTHLKLTHNFLLEFWYDGERNGISVGQHSLQHLITIFKEQIEIEENNKETYQQKLFKINR